MKTETRIVTSDELRKAILDAANKLNNEMNINYVDSLTNMLFASLIAYELDNKLFDDVENCVLNTETL